MVLCRQLVKAAENESESSPLTAAIVVQSPVWFHLVRRAQGKKEKKGAAQEVFSMSSS